MEASNGLPNNVTRAALPSRAIHEQRHGIVRLEAPDDFDGGKGIIADCERLDAPTVRAPPGASR